MSCPVNIFALAFVSCRRRSGLNGTNMENSDVTGILQAEPLDTRITDRIITCEVLNALKYSFRAAERDLNKDGNTLPSVCGANDRHLTLRTARHLHLVAGRDTSQPSTPTVVKPEAKARCFTAMCHLKKKIHMASSLICSETQSR